MVDRRLCRAARCKALLYLISEPAYLFSDFYKAYYPAAKLLLVEDRARAGT